MNNKKPSPVVVNGLYRHFKTGNYYIVNHLATQEADGSHVVVYTSVKTGETYTRPYESFIEDISARPDNAMHQTYRMELASEIKGLLSLVSTDELIEEIKTRPDNPYEGFKTLEEDEDVWSIQFLIGRINKVPETDTEEAYEEFIPVTAMVFDKLEDAKDFASRMFANQQVVIARRVTKAVIV